MVPVTVKPPRPSGATLVLTSPSATVPISVQEFPTSSPAAKRSSQASRSGPSSATNRSSTNAKCPRSAWAMFGSAEARDVSRAKSSGRVAPAPPWDSGTRRAPNPAEARALIGSCGRLRVVSRSEAPAAMSENSGAKRSLSCSSRVRERCFEVGAGHDWRFLPGEVRTNTFDSRNRRHRCKSPASRGESGGREVSHVADCGGRECHARSFSVTEVHARPTKEMRGARNAGDELTHRPWTMRKSFAVSFRRAARRP